MTKGRKRLKIACPGCRQKLDLSDIEPFTRIDCPACGDEIIVPKPFGDLMLEEQLREHEPVAVYRALDLTLDREVAVKTMSPAGGDAAGIRSAFLRQARSAAAVNHPHIVPIYSCGEVDDASYLVMQFMADGSLTEKIRHGGAVDTQWATNVILEVALGLQAAHKHGLVHGDVRPGNVLFDADGHVKVSDFGLTVPLLTEHPGNTSDLKHWGAYPYASPERRRGDACDVRSDIYSLGATLYHVLTGHAPTDDVARSEGADHSPVPPVQLNERIPGALSECIMRMMDAAPEKRPGDYTTIIDALRGLSKRAPRGARAATAAARGGAAGTAQVGGRQNLGLNRPRTGAPTAGRAVDTESRDGQWGWLNVALAAALVVLLALLGFLLLRDRGASESHEGEPHEQAAEPPAADARTAMEADASETISPTASMTQGEPVVRTPAPVQPPEDEVEGPRGQHQPRLGQQADRPSHGPGDDVEHAPEPVPAARTTDFDPGRAAADHRNRPQPPGLDFMAAKDDLKNYLLTLTPDERARERERVALISDSRDYLLQLMRYMPFEPENGHRIQLRDGTSLDGAVPYCNENEVAVRLHGRGNALRRLAWSDLAFEQFVDFFEFYIRTRLVQGGKAGSRVLTQEQKRDVGDDCFRLAVLCDWYGHTEARDRNARRALEFAPAKRNQILRLLPGVAD